MASSTPSLRAVLSPLNRHHRSFRSVTEAGELHEILSKHITQTKQAPSVPLPAAANASVLRHEAIGLYRDILRASRLFTWPNDRGEIWRDVLRRSARDEYEKSRGESDVAKVHRLVVSGRDALHKVIDDMVEKMRKQVEQEAVRRGAAPGEF